MSEAVSTTPFDGDLGVVGLGVMGSNLLLNLADSGFRLAAYDRHPEKVAAVGERLPPDRYRGTASLAELVAALRRPRAVLLLVPAGAPVDAVIDRLAPLLEPGDVVVDGGNSHFTDTDRRGQSLAARELHLLGLGISGGERGARHGASLMAGGPPEAWERLRPLLEKAAARVPKLDPPDPEAGRGAEAGPDTSLRARAAADQGTESASLRAEGGGPIDLERCAAWLGPGSAGHYVKMVHNGIEYGLMQLIAESHALLTRARGLSSSCDAGPIFASWNEGALGGYLMEITVHILAMTDERTGRPLVDSIRDVARQKGTGQWTTQEAFELQVPTPIIDAAVNLRDLSALPGREDLRRMAGEPPPPAAASAEGPATEQLRGALYAGMILTFAQGFALLQAASAAHAYRLGLEEVARVWRGGCIIRAKLLDPIAAAFRAKVPPSNLLLDPFLAGEVRAHQGGLREAVRFAAAQALPAPALMASLSYLDTLGAERLPSNLIQAQRDYFGAHTYERLDAPGMFHTDWEPA